VANRTNPPSGREAPSAERFKTLPAHIRLEDTITSQDVDPTPDPTMGRDTELEFLLRNAGSV